MHNVLFQISVSKYESLNYFTFTTAEDQTFGHPIHQTCSYTPESLAIMIPKLSKPKARIHLLVPATISTSSQESEQLNCCLLPPAHFFVHCSQVLPLCPAHISILTITPRILAAVLYYYAADSVSVMILSERFCFRNSMRQLHTVRGYNRCVYVYTISRIHNTSTGFSFFCIIILSPPPPGPLNRVHSIVHSGSRKTKFCKPLRHSRSLHIYIHTHTYIHTISPSLLCKIHKGKQP